MMRNFVHPELNKALAPIRRRLYIKSLIHMAVLGVIAALFQGLIWLIISFFVPIFNLEIKIAVSGGIAFIIACIVGLIRRPSLRKIAQEIDNHGLHERVITALELSSREDLFARLQRQDAIEELKLFNPKSLNFNIPKNRWIIASSLAIALVILSLLPNPQDQIINQRLQIEKTIKEQVENLEEMAEKQLPSNAELSEKQKEELQKLLKELAQKLEETKDYREAIKEVTKTEEKVIELLKKVQEAKVAQLGEELYKYQITQTLGQKVKGMDEQGIVEEMKKLKEITQTEDIDREAMEDLQKALEDIAKQIGDKDLKTSIQETANSIASDLSLNSQMSLQALNNLEEELLQMVQNPINNPENIMYMFQSMKGNIAQQAGQDISNLAWTEPGQQGDKNENEYNQEPQGGSGNSNQSSLGQGSGTDSSSSSGGNGTGTGNTSQGEGQGSGGGQGSGIGSSHSEYEKIYDPKRLGGEGENSQVTGSVGSEGDNEQINAGQGIGDFNGFIPYNEVFGEYKTQAMERLDRIDIPPNMRELVKGYFSSLED